MFDGQTFRLVGDLLRGGGSTYQMVIALFMIFANTTVFNKAYKFIKHRYWKTESDMKTLTIYKYGENNGNNETRTITPAYYYMISMILKYFEFESKGIESSGMVRFENSRNRKSSYDFNSLKIIGLRKDINARIKATLTKLFGNTDIEYKHNRAGTCFVLRHKDFSILSEISEFLDSDNIQGDVPHGKYEFLPCTYRVNAYTWTYIDKLPCKTFDNTFYSEQNESAIRNIVYGDDGHLRKLFGCPPGQSIFAQGLPATGKSSLADVIGNELGIDVYEMPNDPKLIVEAYNTLPSDRKIIVLWDDMDIRFGLNREGDEGLTEEQLSTVQNLLKLFDGKSNTCPRITIATTNHPDRFDSAIIRPGRFDHIITFGCLDTETAIRILRYRFGEDADIPEDLEIRPGTTPGELVNSYVIIPSMSLEDILDKAFVKTE